MYFHTLQRQLLFHKFCYYLHTSNISKILTELYANCKTKLVERGEGREREREGARARNQAINMQFWQLTALDSSSSSKC